MKAKDFINEGLFSDLSKAASQTIGAYKSRSNATKGLGSRLGAMFSPSRLKYGRSTQDQVAANKFIDKFVRGALETLNVAVKNDLVDATSNDLTIKVDPKQKTGTKAPALAKDVEVVNDEPMILRYRGIDYIIGDKGQWVNFKSNKDAPQSFQAFLHKQADIATPKAVPENSNYEHMNAIFESILFNLDEATKSKKQQGPTSVPYPQRGFSPNTVSSAVPQGGGRIKGAPLSTTPNAVKKRQARAAKKATAQPAQQTTPQQGHPAANQQAAPADKLSISKYFKDKYLDSFFQGIDMAPAQAKIDALLQNLPNLYKSGQLKKELESLANIAWTLAKKQ